MIAPGCTSQTFGTPGVMENALSVNNVGPAIPDMLRPTFSWFIYVTEGFIFCTLKQRKVLSQWRKTFNSSSLTWGSPQQKAAFIKAIFLHAVTTAQISKPLSKTSEPLQTDWQSTQNISIYITGIRPCHQQIRDSSPESIWTARMKLLSYHQALRRLLNNWI